jgi:hypothetical protein
MVGSWECSVEGTLDRWAGEVEVGSVVDARAARCVHFRLFRISTEQQGTHGLGTTALYSSCSIARHVRCLRQGAGRVSRPLASYCNKLIL